MEFEAMKTLTDGVPDYLEVPVEDGLLDKATAVIRNLGYDMEEAISIFLQRIIQTPHQNVDKERAEEQVREITDATLDDMVTQPLLLPRRDVFCVELADYAMPGFCSNWKPYFGSIEDITEFRRALHSDDCRKPEDMNFMSVKLYGAKHNTQEAGMYEHTNIWGFPCFVWWDKLESIHLWIGHEKKFCRCVRVRMKNLQYATDKDASMKHSPGGQIWGYPHVLEYRYPFHFSRMYVIEKKFDTEDNLLEDMEHYNGSIELKGWLRWLIVKGKL